MKTVLFLGFRKSGKTFAIVMVSKELVKRGDNVGTLKHIHDKDFSIDTEGKDTWRHAAAGASTIVSMAPRELAIIEKRDTTNLTIDHLIGIFASRDVDYLLIEGLYGRFSRRRGVVLVLCATSARQARELLRLHPKPVCILDNSAGGIGSIQGIPILRLPRDLPVLMNLISLP